MTPDFYHKPRKTNDSKIAQARRKKGWTQQQLADAIGSQQKYIARWETGAIHPKPATIVKIANALGVELKELI